MITRMYYTFGQAHIHRVNGRTFDKDCVVEIIGKDSEQCQKRMREAFGQQWANSYGMCPDLSFYPRGVITLNPQDR